MSLNVPFIYIDHSERSLCCDDTFFDLSTILFPQQTSWFIAAEKTQCPVLSWQWTGMDQESETAQHESDIANIFINFPSLLCQHVSGKNKKKQNSNNIWAFRSKITSSGHNINIKMFILFKIIKILIEVLTNMWQIQCKVSLALQQLLNGISGALVAETSEKFLLKFLRSWNF